MGNQTCDRQVGATEGSAVGEQWPARGSLLSLRYRLRVKLATGGMAEIWRADDELLGRAVALKLPRPRAAEIWHEAWIEARTTARLSHPHIAAVHDYGEEQRPDGTVVPFVVMELLDGESLAARLTRGRLPWQEAARIGSEVASALAMAHASKVVHRDIKPGNIMLTSTGSKILDFGISAAAGTPDDDETGATFGTPAYVAPERLDGTPAEPATDVYALGTVLFEMVNGEPPYPVDTWEEFAEARAWDRFAAARATAPDRLPEELPASFRDLVGQCLSDDPWLRPAASEVHERLAALRPPSPGPLAGGMAVRRRVAAVRVAIAALLLVAAGAAVGLVSWSNGGGTPRTAPDRAGPAPTTATPAVGPTPAGPPAEPPVTTPTTVSSPPPASTSTEPEIGLTAAVDSVISVVEAGQATGDIREDVAVDLINLLRQLHTASPDDVGRRVAELQQKVRARAAEGSLARSYADDLWSSLDRVDRAARA
jgi:serine/threonine-protein kinase